MTKRKTGAFALRTRPKPLLVLAAALLAASAFSRPLLAGEEDGEGRPARLRDNPRERAAWTALQKVDSRGAVSSENRLRALRAACLVPADTSLPLPSAGRYPRSDAGPSVPRALATAGGWEPLGPSPARALAYGNVDFGLVSGRITAVAIHPTNPSIVLVGAATGGIWKSTDAGRTFRAVSDSAPALATSALAFSPSDPNVVYAATGEADSADLEFSVSRSLGTYLGAGLLRSLDGGESWTRVDVDLPPNAVLSRVVPHPTDPSRVLVGVYIWHDVEAGRARVGGVYLSTDGGVHFSRTLNHAVSDLVQDPNAAGTVWAGIGVTGGCTSCTLKSGVYVSTDFGATWTPSLTADTPGATFAAQTGNVKLGLSRTNPLTLYASIVDTGDKHDGGGIFRSADGGATWVKRAVHVGMCPSSGLNQCSYDHVILPSPTSPDTVYFGSVDLYRSTDGAASWKMLTNVYSAGGSVHVDHHAMAIPPSAPDTVYFANDGGLYRSTDGGTTFENLNASLGLIQFNGIALHPTNPDLMMGGTQDNGNLRYTGSPLWEDRTGSDGGFDLIRADDPSQVLAANYYAYMNFSQDGGIDFADVTPFGKLMTLSGDAKEPMGFYPPAMAAPAAPGLVFLGTQRLWANPTFGRDPSQWAPRSAAAITATRISALDVLGDGSGPAWIGSSSGEVYFSTDGGATFTKRSDGLPAAFVSSIHAVTPDGLSAYATFAGYLGSPSRHVFVTTDGGVTWTNVTSNLPDVPVSALAVAPADPSTLFVATDVGVFRSADSGASWTSLNEGLPNTTVTALAFHPVTRDLVASTYGRGAWRLPFAVWSVPVGPAADFAFAPADPAPRQSVLFEDRSTGGATAFAWDFGDATPASAERSPRHAYAAAGTYPVRLTITAPGGSSTKTRSVTVRAGVTQPVTFQVPVVLDVFGAASTHYTSDLVLVNRTAADVRASLVYVPAPGTPGAGGPRLPELVPAGQELRFADLLDHLRSSGYALPPSGPAQVGTLRVTFEDAADASQLFAGSRTSTPNPNAAVGGSFGLFAAGALPSEAVAGSTAVFGLKQDASARSNLAVVDVPPSDTEAGSPARLSIQVMDGATGAAAGSPVEVTLAPAEWRQLDQLLAPSGVTNGWVRITRTGGTNRFLAYGVVNDGSGAGKGTSDGSYVPAGSPDGLVPIVLRVSAGGTLYTTQLALANPTAAAVIAQVTYTPAPAFGGGPAVTASVPLAAGRQLVVPDVILWLRDTLGLPLPAGDGNQAGTLLVTGAVAVARTTSPNPDASVGGSFGLAYGAVPAAARARSEAWVYGLVQDGATRSNLAVADARVGSATAQSYRIDVFDAGAGAGDGATPAWSTTISLKGGEWYQESGILSTAGLTRGYARVRAESGSSDFVAYGVLNDGAGPGERTSDGSYVPMSGVR